MPITGVLHLTKENEQVIKQRTGGAGQSGVSSFRATMFLDWIAGLGLLEHDSGIFRSHLVARF